MISLNLSTAQIWTLALGLVLALLALGLLWQWAAGRMRRRLRVGKRVIVRIWTQQAGRWGLASTIFGTVIHVHAGGVTVNTAFGQLPVGWEQVTTSGHVNYYALDPLVQP